MMNISEIISRYADARLATTMKIIERGGTVAGGFEAFPSAIDTIPSGGGGGWQSVFANKITAIGSSAFKDVSELTEIDLPEAVVFFSDAFKNCVNLSKVTIHKAVSVFMDSVFNGCVNLESIKYSFASTMLATSYCFEGCTKLSEGFFKATGIRCIVRRQAFSGCSELRTVYIDAPGLTVTYPLSIGSAAFYGCSKLMSLYLLTSVISTISKDTFTGTPMSSSIGGVYGSIIVYESLISSLRLSTGWSFYSERFSIYNGTDYSEVFS